MTDLDTKAAAPPTAKLTFWTMTAMVVGSMVGAGVFSLPRRFAQETGVAGALIAWVVAGTGMLMLAFVFQVLALRRPHLDAGVYAYAKAGFGEYPGFFSAFGYWASACVGNVTYWVLIMSTIGAIAPALGDGDTVLAVVLSSVGLWAFFVLISRGIKEATAINRIVTVAKLVPIVVFVVIAVFYLDPGVFADNFAGADYAGSLFDQVRGTMLATVFVFLGVEGASVLFLVVTLFSDDAFNFALDMTSALTLIPFLLAAGYAMKVARGHRRDLVVALLATAYTAFLLFAAGLKYVLVSFIVYAPATILFVMARREQGRRLFSPGEAVLLAASIAGAVLGVVALAAGWISL
jgi:amino acid transporter